MWFYAAVTKQLCLLDVCNSGEYFDILEGWLEILCVCLDMLHSGHESVATFSDGFLAILIHDGCSKVFYFSTRIPARESRSGIALVGILRWRCESVALRPSRGPIEITFVFARGNHAILVGVRLYAYPPCYVQFQLLRLLLVRYLFDLHV